MHMCKKYTTFLHFGKFFCRVPENNFFSLFSSSKKDSGRHGDKSVVYLCLACYKIFHDEERQHGISP